jgi:hypothetical protein
MSDYVVIDITVKHLGISKPALVLLNWTFLVQHLLGYVIAAMVAYIY